MSVTHGNDQATRWAVARLRLRRGRFDPVLPPSPLRLEALEQSEQPIPIRTLPADSRCRRVCNRPLKSLLGEGLHHIVHSVDLESLHRVIAVSGHEDDGRGRIGRDAGQNAEAAPVGHLDIEQDNLRPERVDRIDRPAHRPHLSDNLTVHTATTEGEEMSGSREEGIRSGGEGMRRSSSTRLIAAIIGVSLASCASALVAQTAQPSPAFQRAATLIGQQDFDGAVVVLDSLLVTDPDNGLALSALGFSLLNLQRWDGARVALEAALESGNATPGVPTNLVMALGQLGALDEAFARLAELKAARTSDLTTLGLGPLGAPLREDPRFSDVLPTEAEFAKPFGEAGIHIVREWVGEAAGSNFGWIARSAGDVDGDGLQDVLTSAPFLNQGAGRVYVYASSDGRLIWQADGEPGWQLGLGIENAGDVNGDGTPDAYSSSAASLGASSSRSNSLVANSRLIPLSMESRRSSMLSIRVRT